MLAAHPGDAAVGRAVLADCIEACLECAQTCTACADACLAEEGDMDLRHCIRTDLDCADICTATAKVLSRQTAPAWNTIKAQVGACLKACEECGATCREHADHHDHCRVCGKACKRCEEACAALLNALEDVPSA